MRWFRPNPPVDELPRAMREVVSSGRSQMRRMGVDRAKPLGCGLFGCVFPRDEATVLKVTTDPYELKMVRLIQRLRGRMVSVDSLAMEALEDAGSTPGKACRLPGIVGYHGAPRKAGRGWAYVRENVLPLDAMHDSRPIRKVAKGLDRYFYGKPVVIHEFLGKFPELRHIVATDLWLDFAYELSIEDVHEEQVGVVVKTSKLHRAGTLVLYDGQVG